MKSETKYIINTYVNCENEDNIQKVFNEKLLKVIFLLEKN